MQSKSRDAFATEAPPALFFYLWFSVPIDNGLTFTIIVDESHQNDTIKADDILALFNANKIIRCSATPKNYKNALLIEIPEEDVIAEGLIKKLLIINENFEQHISVEDQISYLLDKALEKQRDLRAAYAKKDSGVNPLIIVQLPNKSDALLDRVEEYFESKGSSSAFLPNSL